MSRTSASSARHLSLPPLTKAPETCKNGGVESQHAGANGGERFDRRIADATSVGGRPPIVEARAFPAGEWPFQRGMRAAGIGAGVLIMDQQTSAFDPTATAHSAGTVDLGQGVRR